MRKAIVLTCFQRPFYLKPVLDAWQCVEGYQDWPFIFMLEPSPTKHAMLRCIDEFAHQNVTVIHNEKKLGVLNNPHEGLKFAFRQNYDFVVLAEEDLKPSVDVLNYFDFAAKEYEAEQDVLMACTNPYVATKRPDEVHKRQEFAVWIWGTWANRWPLISTTWDHDYSTGAGDTAGWDWNLTLRVLPQHDKVAVFPGIPLVDNLGQYLGIHANPADYENSRPIGFEQYSKFNWHRSEMSIT